MAILRIDKRSEDNKYLHRDFHISGDIGIAYVGEKYGDQAVAEYLMQFTDSYYKPLVESVKKEGLKALADAILKLYKAEEAEGAIEIALTENRLDVKVNYCPAVRYMKSMGHEPSKWYEQTTRTVYCKLAQNCKLEFEMGKYDSKTGKTSYFFRRNEV